MPVIPSSHRDLLEGQFATLGTIGPDGRPQLSEVWFLADGDTIGISLNTSRQKTKNLLANPAVSCSSWTWQSRTATWRSAATLTSPRTRTTRSPTGSARNTARTYATTTSRARGA